MNLLKLLFSPRGDIKRGKFVLGLLLSFFITFLLLHSAGLEPETRLEILNEAGEAALGLACLVSAMMYALSIVLFLYFLLPLGLKRLRNIGASPWFVITLYIPFLNILALLSLAFWPSKAEKKA